MKKLIAFCVVLIGVQANAQLPSEKPMEELLPRSSKQTFNHPKTQSISQVELPSVAPFPKQFILHNRKTLGAVIQKKPQAQLPSDSNFDWQIAQSQKRKKKK